MTAAIVGLEAAPVVVTLYLLEIVARYLEHDEVGAGGTEMSRLAGWVPDALRWCLKELDRTSP